MVLVSGITLAQFGSSDRMAEAHAMISLVEQGWANQNEVARAFGCCVRTVRRHQRAPKRAVWQHWDIRTDIRPGGCGWLLRGNGWCNDSRARALLSARSRAEWG